MRLLVVSLFSLVALTASGCSWAGNNWGWSEPVRGSGLLASETRATEAFDAIVVGGSFELKVEVGAPRDVHVSADDNLLELIETRVEGGTLYVRTREGYSSRNDVEVSVRTPELRSLSASGSHEIEVRGVHGGSFELSSSGSNSLRVSGEVERLTVDLSGSSEVDTVQLLARDAVVNSSGSSSVSLHASESLALSLSGSSEIRYAGAPRIETSQSGSSSVSRIQ